MNEKGKYPRLSVTVPPDLKEEMDACETRTNWSKIAADAFRRALSFIAGPSEEAKEEAKQKDPNSVRTFGLSHLYEGSSDAMRNYFLSVAEAYLVADASTQVVICRMLGVQHEFMKWDTTPRWETTTPQAANTPVRQDVGRKAA